MHLPATVRIRDVADRLRGGRPARTVAVNLLGAVRGCHAFASMFKAQRAGHIVNTASLAGLVHGPVMGGMDAAFLKAGRRVAHRELHEAPGGRR